MPWTKSDDENVGVIEDAPRLALRPREVARALGISERVLWGLTADQARGIPHFRIGRSVLYPRAALERWIDQRWTQGVRANDCD